MFISRPRQQLTDPRCTRGRLSHVGRRSPPSTTIAAALFVWAPDLRIEAHPLRVAKDNLTAVTGVMKGTFTQPMPDGKGGTIAPTGNAFALNMITVGIWNRQGTMMRSSCSGTARPSTRRSAWPGPLAAWRCLPPSGPPRAEANKG